MRYALEACEALEYVHEQNLVHRDVKPQNMVLADHGVVLVDFGIAREVDEDAGTRAVGTPQFMAPEILVGEGVSAPQRRVRARSDAVDADRRQASRLPGRTRLAETDRRRDVGARADAAKRAGASPRAAARVGEAFAKALGSPLGVSAGRSLAMSVSGPAQERGLLESIVRTAAGVLEAAASSIALIDEVTGELVYQAAWGAGADEIVGVRLPPGIGIAGAVVASGEELAVVDCRNDARFADRIARGTGYVPHTMMVVPLRRDGAVVGALSVLDRRDGSSYDPSDLPRGRLFGELADATLAAGSSTGPGS